MSERLGFDSSFHPTVWSLELGGISAAAWLSGLPAPGGQCAPSWGREHAEPLCMRSLWPSAAGLPAAGSRSAFDERLGRVEDSYISCCGFSGITMVAVKPAVIY